MLCNELGFRKWIAALLCGAVLALSGCSVAKMAKGESGTDLSPIRPGMTRAQAEAIVGPSVRDWQTPAGVRYCVYRYDAGTRADSGWLLGNAFMDVVSLGTWELLPLLSPNTNGHHIQQLVGQIAISYDSSDVILGVFRDFGDFDALPANGLAPGPIP